MEKYQASGILSIQCPEELLGNLGGHVVGSAGEKENFSLTDECQFGVIQPALLAIPRAGINGQDTPSVCKRKV